jgi:TonB family protein
MLSLQDELQNIENELNEEAASEAFGSRTRAFAATAWTAVSTRPVQAAIAGGSALALLLAALVAQPRAAESTSDRPAQNGDMLTSRADANAAAPSGLDPNASLTRTSAGSLEMRPVSSAPAARSNAPVRASEQTSSERKQTETESPASLELARSVRTALPNIDVKGVDSIGRTADYTAKAGTGAFSRQFWTAGTDQKATSAEASSLPTRAKIQGALPQPSYPEFLRKNGVEGEVVVQFLVDETGRPDVSTLEVVRSPHDDLTEAVRRVINRIHFDPALTGGPSPKPRTEVVRISYLFKAASK